MGDYCCHYNPCCPIPQPTPPPLGSDDPTPQRHVHEVIGSVMIAEPMEEPHNHRFATVSGPAIIVSGGHVHDVAVRTDFYDDHYHVIAGQSGLPTQVGDRHVHYLNGATTTNDGHSHQFRAASLIDNPIGD